MRSGQFPVARTRGANSSVLVVGDIMTDIIVKPKGALSRGSDRWATIRMLPGGSGANQAAWLGHFGVATSFVAKVGRPDLGRYEAMMRRYGVTPKLCSDRQTPTGVLVAIVDRDGQRSFLTDRGANDTLDRVDLPDDLLDGIAPLHISGYALFAERPRTAVLNLARRALRLGVTISVDPASTSFLEQASAAAFLNWTQGAAICFPNDDEAAALTGTRDEERQLSILSRHYGLVVIKRGSQGAEIGGRDGKRLCRLPAPLVSAIDTTGAGDAFLAGYLAAHLAKAPLEECLRRGIAAGSAATMVFGGQPPSLSSRSRKKGKSP
jgi:sugar/nucleoside kinase (ribokinase family)